MSVNRELQARSPNVGSNEPNFEKEADVVRRLLATTVALLVLGLVVPASSAPLFPDVPDAHWAKDAVAALAAKGLVEGYPDGTFKGDRAASRWETAMIVARLLAKMEQAHATFATKAELEEVRKLTNALREELDALGVRVTNLEENVNLLDKRVSELERISFYGYVDTRVAMQSFRNTGTDAQRSLFPGVGFENINFNQFVGSAAGAGGAVAPVSGAPALGGIAAPGFGGVVPVANPFSIGVLTTTNWRQGRPLTNGTGFTMRGVLGLRIDINDDLEAGVEFSAYTSQGDAIVDAYYGVQQPYLSSPWTATSVNGGAGAQGLNNNPFTRMTLDRFWLTHSPTNTKLILGAFNEQSFNDTVFAGLKNPQQFGNEFLDNFGILVKGELPLDDEEDLIFDWEVMGTVLPDGSTGPVTPGTPGIGTGYFSHAEGINVGLRFHEERGNVKLNFLHAADDASGGAVRATGLIQTPILGMNWVNPNGFFIGQLNQFGSTGGIGSSGDKRPVPTNPIFGLDGSQAALVAAGLRPQGVPNVGGVGPQDQVTYGLSAEYEWDNKFSPRIYAEYAHSEYRPNKNSSYTADGDAWKIGGNILFMDGDIALQAEYLHTDPRFSPFLIQIPQVGGISTPLWRSDANPTFNYWNNLYALHDTRKMPHNREGFRLEGTWKFRPTGRVQIEYGNYDQVTTSLQDVRFSTSSLGVGVPNSPVLGYSPGWIEPIFGGFHQATFAPSGGNAFAVPLENPSGKQEFLTFRAGHKWLLEEAENDRGVTLSGGFRWNDLERRSNMQSILAARGMPGAGTQAESVNNVDLVFLGFKAQVEYDVTEDFAAYLGYTQVHIFGHLDPLGGASQFAEATGQTNFDNVDITQKWPEIGFDWEIHDDVTWGVNAKYFFMDDNLPSRMFINPSTPTLNVNNGPQTTHPFNWEGPQITSSLSVRF